MKAAWKAYEEKMLVQLKAEKPGLKMSQYKDMMWKLWQKAPVSTAYYIQYHEISNTLSHRWHGLAHVLRLGGGHLPQELRFFMRLAMRPADVLGVAAVTPTNSDPSISGLPFNCWSWMQRQLVHASSHVAVRLKKSIEWNYWAWS